MTKDNYQFKRLAILGLGLMGGSLGLAVKRARLAGEVRGYARRAVVRKRALARRVVDCVFERPEDAVRGADFVVLCTPVMTMPALMKACLPVLSKGCVVTDVGSTKAWLADAMATLLKQSPAVYVGSHPVAGSERQGLESARSDLYRQAAVIVSVTARTDRKASQQVAAFWRRLGARVVMAAPRHHDRMLAKTSHLPHLAACLVADTAGRGGPNRIKAFCGTGFQGVTRLAEGDPALWHDIFKTNRAAILDELRRFQQAAGAVQRLMAKNDFEGVRRFLARSRRLRRKVLGSG